MQDSIGVWTIRTPAAGQVMSAGTARMCCQYVASSTNTAEVLYFKISQSGSAVSAMESVALIVPAAASTVTAGVTSVGTTATVIDWAGGASTLRATLSTSAVGSVGTSAVTINGNYHQMDFNVLAGYEWNAQPNMRVWVPASGIVGVYCGAITSLTFNVEMVVREMK